MTLLDKMITALRGRFPSVEFKIEQEDKSIRIPAKHPEVGDVIIWDEGDEATVGIGDLTHLHLNPYDPSLSDDERNARIADHLIWFVEALFDDRAYFLCYPGGAGGSTVVEKGGRFTVPEGATAYTWSGPYQQ